jgi:hypothetical protein
MEEHLLRHDKYSDMVSTQAYEQYQPSGLILGLVRNPSCTEILLPKIMQRLKLKTEADRLSSNLTRLITINDSTCCSIDNLRYHTAKTLWLVRWLCFSRFVFVASFLCVAKQ